MKQPNPFAKAAMAVRAGSRRADPEVAHRLTKAAHIILSRAKREAPVLTGALRASGRVRVLNQYSRAIEFGGRGTGVDYALAVEFGTFRTRPQPFLRRSVMATKKQVKAQIGKGVERIFVDTARQGSSR